MSVLSELLWYWFFVGVVFFFFCAHNEIVVQPFFLAERTSLGFREVNSGTKNVVGGDASGKH